MTRGYYGVGIYRPKREVNVGGLWRTAMSYGAAYIATVGERYNRQAADTCSAPKHIPLHHYADFSDLVDHLPHGCPVVAVELDKRAVPLDAYTHPKRAFYLLGAEDHGIPPWVLGLCHEVVQIPTPTPWSLNVATAGALVLADRYRKGMQ